MTRFLSSYPRSARREARFLLVCLVLGGLLLVCAVLGFVALVGWHLQPRTACLQAVHAVALLQTDPPREVVVLHCVEYVDISTGEVSTGALLKK